MLVTAKSSGITVTRDLVTRYSQHWSWHIKVSSMGLCLVSVQRKGGRCYYRKVSMERFLDATVTNCLNLLLGFLQHPIHLQCKHFRHSTFLWMCVAEKIVFRPKSLPNIFLLFSLYMTSLTQVMRPNARTTKNGYISSNLFFKVFFKVFRVSNFFQTFYFLILNLKSKVVVFKYSTLFGTT